MKTKHESRIVITKCYDEVCLGIIIRGEDVDGAVSGRNCQELCAELVNRGFMGELRFSAGDCRCNLPLPPDKRGATILQVLSARLPLWVERVKRILTGKI